MPERMFSVYGSLPLPMAVADAECSFWREIPHPANCPWVIARFEGQLGIPAIYLNDNRDLYDEPCPIGTGEMFTI